ncbi:hypothetical protein LTR08_001505 [Meristemomyces frigidus]|nr:hypothetical protein LTR08_001505 [Meristemomyces frigidus]
MSTTDPQSAAPSPAATPSAKKSSRFGRALTSTSRLLDSQFIGPDQAEFWETLDNSSESNADSNSEPENLDPALRRTTTTTTNTTLPIDHSSPPPTVPRQQLIVILRIPNLPPAKKARIAPSKLNPALFDRAHVEAHPGQDFHHVGRGRYKAGAKPLKPLLPPTLELGERAVLPPKLFMPVGAAVLEGGGPVQGKGVGDEVVVSGETGITTPPPPTTSEIQRAKPLAPNTNFDRAHVSAHPEQIFHHVGAGRYRPGPKPPSAPKAAAPAPAAASEKSAAGRDVAVVAAPGAYTFPNSASFDRQYVAAHPGEEFHHVGCGRYRAGPKAAKAAKPVEAPMPDASPGAHLSDAVPAYWPSSPYLSHVAASLPHAPAAAADGAASSGQRKKRGKYKPRVRQPQPPVATPGVREASGEGAWVQPGRAAGEQRGSAADHVMVDVPELGHVQNATASTDGTAYIGQTGPGALEPEQLQYPSVRQDFGAYSGQTGLEAFAPDYLQETPASKDVRASSAQPGLQAFAPGYLQGTPASQDIGEYSAQPRLQASEPGHLQNAAAQNDGTTLHRQPAPYGPESGSALEQANNRKHGKHNACLQAPAEEDDDHDYEPAQALELVKEKRPKRTYKSRKNQAVLPEDGQPAPQSVQPNLKRKRPAPAASSLGDLVIALALVKLLCGGLAQQRLNWDLISHVLSFRDDKDALQTMWKHHSKYAGQDVEQLQAAMREPFLSAYERGDVPHIDFQDIERTDWPALFGWWKGQETCPGFGGSARAPRMLLPESTAALCEEFVVMEREDRALHASEAHFNAGTDIARNSTALNLLQSYPLKRPQTAYPHDADDLMLLKSWCRAVALTKSANYDPDTAAAKLSPFPSPLLKRATDALLAAGILAIEKKGRQVPGRNYYPSRRTLKLFQRWPPPPTPETPSLLRQAAAARARLVAHFQHHATAELSHHAPDADVLVLTNMVAQRHLHARTPLPAREDAFDAPHPRLSAWGIGDAANLYNSSDYDATRMRFPVVYHRTAAFPGGGATHGLKTGVPVPVSVAIVGNEAGMRTPFWVDIHGAVIGDLWELVLQSLLHLVVFRSGITAQGISTAHEGKLWVWELHVVLGWMEEVGLVVRCGRGREVEEGWLGGWRAGEWWYCAFAPDVAVWELE